MNEHLDFELSEYLDGELDGAALARVEAHLAACAECRDSLEEMRCLVRRAGSLDDRPPERDLWSGIAARIVSEPTADVVPLASRRRVSFSMPQLAAAAIALMALSAVAGSMLRRPDAATVATAPEASTVSRTVNDRVGRAVTSYETAIGDLERTLDARRGDLDTATIRVVAQSLRLIDLAIAEARAALARDPGNLYLNGTLQRALDHKLVVLRQVTLNVAS